MIDKILDPVIAHLRTGKEMIDKIDADVYSDNSVGPYNASIGGHIRHVLDIFDCIFAGFESLEVDLTARKRNELVETNPQYGNHYINDVIKKLDNLRNVDEKIIVKVTDDLGMGPVETDYTLSGALCQAHSHAIHHFACIGYVLKNHNIDLPNSRFGYNPTTPVAS